ncbi:MAG: tRNA pseudouridine(38-40) synthase TruA [Carboxydocellales bacterium]
MRNLKLTIEYDGTAYHGFQNQNTPELPTIQGVMEQLLTELSGAPVNINGASRTDAGVHARGQVFNFKTNWSIPVERVPLAVNSAGLPPDIVVREAAQVPMNFHAQFDALAKTYTYTLYNSRIPAAFQHRYTYYVPQRLRVEAMAEALQGLVGTQDFAAFKAVGSTVKSSTRTIFATELEQNGPLIMLRLTGNGFLYNMIRIIVGTILKVGKGKLLPEDIPKIIASKDRTKAGPTAPPQGLCLDSITYPEQPNPE